VSPYRGALIIAALAVAAGLTSWLWPGQREAAAIAALTFAPIAGIAALMAWPPGVAFITERSRLIVAVGWGVCIVGFVGGLGLAVIVGRRSSTAINIAMYAGLGVAFLGFMAARLPRSVTQAARSTADLAALKSTGASRPTFDGLNEGWTAVLSVLRDGRAFLQITAPWAVVLAGATCLLLSFEPNVARGSTSAGLLLLALLLLLVAAIYLIVPTVAVAWFRWTIEGRLPSRFVALPDRTVLSLAWRLWTFLTILGVINRVVTPRLTALAASAAPQHAVALGGLAGCAVDILMLMGASSPALQLPALAVRDTAFNETAAMVEGRKMWPGLPLGLALSLAAFPFLAWVCVRTWQGLSQPAPVAHAAAGALGPLNAIALAGWLMVAFATLVSGASLLSRAYVVAKTRIDGVLG